MKIKKVNKTIKIILIFLFGVEYCCIPKISLNEVKIKNLRELLCEDAFGVYKKENVRIPLKYKSKYKLYKKWREELIFAKYYKLNITTKYGLRKQYYLYKNMENPSEHDKIVIKKLLSKG